MSTDVIFGAATHADPEILVCFTRDGERHELPGPMNMAEVGAHRASMRFAIGHSVHMVRFQRRGDHLVEVASERSGL